MTTVNICEDCLSKVTREYDRAKCNNGRPCNICGLPAKSRYANTVIRYKPIEIGD